MFNIFGHDRRTRAINLSETEIRYAMENTKSCADAARFLRVSYETFRKYAKMYKDDESGLNLFELHKNQSGKNTLRPKRQKLYGHHGLNDILKGKYPNYNFNRLKDRIIRAGIFEERCSECGFCERRAIDYTVPLILDPIDGDRTNHKQENLRLLCYNCGFLLGSKSFSRKMIDS